MSSPSKPRIQTEYLFRDKPCPSGSAWSDDDALQFDSHGSLLRGQIMWPDASFDAPRPCVILLHGYPGCARNDDLAHALCRSGCVVLTPHHRGAWGSEGDYLITNCIEDTVALVDHVQSPRFCRTYHTDPECTFLIGHSMGACTALNASKQISDLAGLVLMTPFDPTRWLRSGETEKLDHLIRQGAFMNKDGFDAICDDLASHSDQLAFETCADRLGPLPVLCITGAYDEIEIGRAHV